jgi:hypothetical protein
MKKSHKQEIIKKKKKWNKHKPKITQKIDFFRTKKKKKKVGKNIEFF